MWRREGEMVEKMLRRAKSRSEMLSIGEKKSSGGTLTR